MRSRGAVRAIALKVLPVEAIHTFIIGYALGNSGVLLYDVVDDVVNFVIANSYSPPPVFDSVVDALQS